MSLPKLIVVLGTTACGKSGLGVELALRFGGEIVSADSRQVYRGLDLGAGKITPQEMRGVPHHMLDVAEPNGPMGPLTAFCPVENSPFWWGAPGCTCGR